MPSLRTLPQDLRNFARYHLVHRSVDYPARETELGVVSLGFELDAYVAELRAFEGRFDVDEIASVDYRGRSHPILRLRSQNRAAPRRLLVLAGVHGNEQAGLLAIPEVLETFDDEGDVELTVVTPVNPVGAAELSRYNAEGYDINRDFVLFRTPEARAVRRVAEETRPDFVVSLHEGPQDAAFFFANGRVERDLAERLLAALARGGTELATENYFGATLEPAGLSPTGPVGQAVSWLWAKSLRMKATSSFFDDRGVPEITLESSWRSPDRETRVRAHVDLVRAVIAELGTDRRG